MPIQTAEAYDYACPEQHYSWTSARKLVPLLVDLLKPSSVIDVGCGIGIWLSVFEDAAVKDVMGVDGKWIKAEQLVVDEDRFVGMDLNEPSNLTSIQRKFDLVLCLEVAEHLSASNADRFVEGVAGLGDVVCFSAAIPGQGGYEHVNEQWPSYWAKKFQQIGFSSFDFIRPVIAGDKDIHWFYRQNTIVYANEHGRGRCAEALCRRLELDAAPESLDFVLAEHFIRRTDPQNYSLREVFRALPRLIGARAVARMKKGT